jgi:hypothetical protein
MYLTMYQHHNPSIHKNAAIIHSKDKKNTLKIKRVCFAIGFDLGLGKFHFHDLTRLINPGVFNSRSNR